MTICGQKTCDRPAIFQTFWPGRPPLPACEEHRAAAVGLGRVMGFHVPVQVLAEWLAGED